MLKFLKTPFLFLHFTYYTLITFLMMLAVILLSMLMILLAIPRYSTCDQSSDLWHQLKITAELESDLQDTVDWGRKWLVDSKNGKTQLVLFDRSSNTSAINVKLDGPVLDEKSSF